MKRALQGLREQESRPEVSVLKAQRQSGCAVCDWACAGGSQVGSFDGETLRQVLQAHPRSAATDALEGVDVCCPPCPGFESDACVLSCLPVNVP